MYDAGDFGFSRHRSVFFHRVCHASGTTGGLRSSRMSVGTFLYSSMSERRDAATIALANCSTTPPSPASAAIGGNVGGE